MVCNVARERNAVGHTRGECKPMKEHLTETSNCSCKPQSAQVTMQSSTQQKSTSGNSSATHRLHALHHAACDTLRKHQ